MEVSPVSGSEAPSQTIGVGIVGLSAERGWAARAHLPALRLLPQFSLRGICGSSIGRARAAADKFDVAFSCADPAELAARPEIDLVVVAVRVPSHRDIVEAAIGAGAMVLCEWPLGNGLAEAEELHRVAEAAKVKTFVGLQARATPQITYIRDLISSGEIGEVLSTTLVGSGGRWGPTVASDVIYLLDRSNGATLLTIPFGHAVDALCSSLGEFTELNATLANRRPVVLVEGTNEHVPMTAEDQVAVTGVLDSGVVATVHYRGGRSAGTNLRWEINGSRGDIVLSGTNGHLQHGLGSLSVSRGPGLPLLDEPIPNGYWRPDGDRSSPSLAVAHNYAQIADDIVDGSRRAPSYADAVLRHRMLAAIEESAATGTRASYR